MLSLKIKITYNIAFVNCVSCCELARLGNNNNIYILLPIEFSRFNYGILNLYIGCYVIFQRIKINSISWLDIFHPLHITRVLFIQYIKNTAFLHKHLEKLHSYRSECEIFFYINWIIIILSIRIYHQLNTHPQHTHCMKNWSIYVFMYSLN